MRNLFHSVTSTAEFMYCVTTMRCQDVYEFWAWSGVARSCAGVLEASVILLLEETEENSDRCIWMVGLYWCAWEPCIFIAWGTKDKRDKYLYIAGWGRKSCVLRPGKPISWVSRCLLHVSRTETRPNLPNRTGSEPAAQRGAPHTHKYRDTSQRLSFRRFRRLRIRYVHGKKFSMYVDFLLQPFYVLWYRMLLVSSCINPSFKLSTATRDIVWRIALSALGEICSGPKWAVK